MEAPERTAVQRRRRSAGEEASEETAGDGRAKVREDSDQEAFPKRRFAADEVSEKKDPESGPARRDRAAYARLRRERALNGEPMEDGKVKRRPKIRAVDRPENGDLYSSLDEVPTI
jgi:hypothetical protein